ncbi:MAG: hypothetical protein SFW62_05790 [Alphaproteobacteria bacterium]|nr:hypothetical protein [Alphaproteobacteria bacterium]
MQQLNAYHFYELGARLHSIFNDCTQHRVADMFAPLTEAQALLDGFIKGDTFPLESSKADATRLLNKIGGLFNRYFIDPTTKQLKKGAGEDRIDPQELSMIRALIEKFEHALAAEMNRASTYFADKIGIYATHDLAENARWVFSVEQRASIPEAAQDEFDAAGRALAFGLGTAATLHLLRAVEIMLKPYFEHFAGAVAAKGERNYAVYLKKLAALADEDEKEPRPDKHVLQMLAQIKDHYRNPLLASESAVTLDEAAQLFGTVGTLISLMAKPLKPARQPGPRGGKKSSPSANFGNGNGDDEEMYDFRLSQAG